MLRRVLRALSFLVPAAAFAQAPAQPQVFTVEVAGASATNNFFALVTQTPVTLRGTNTLAGAARVTVNGFEATNNVAEGTWVKTHMLNPGVNRLFIASLDGGGNILAAVERDVVYEPSRHLVGGILTSNTSWSTQVFRVTNNLVVPAGVTLTVGAGTTVLLSSGASIMASGGGTVAVNGTEESPTFFLPAGNSAWGSLMATGLNASVTLRHAEIVAGQVRPVNGGAVLMEDSVHRDLPDLTRELIAGVNGGNLTIRRSYFARFTEVDARDTPVLIEDCLFEEFLVDGVDLKATNAPLIVRNSTLRFGNPNNSNADAVDFGPGAGTVERCLIHGFRDKGVSMGGAPGTHVSGSLIYDCGIGVSAYSSTGVVLANNTITRCADGILFRNDPQPGVGTGTNLIVWGNTNNVTITNTSSLVLTFSDVGGGFTGTGNISADPLFVDPATRDYRLHINSPARGTGTGAVDMGAIFPVGGIPASPAMLAAHMFGSDGVRLSWQEDADNETEFQIQRSTNGFAWTSVGSAARNATEFIESGLEAGRLYFYRIAAGNSSGRSHYSNIASAAAGLPSVAFNSIAPSGTNGVALTFTAAASRTYTIQFRDSLTTGTWQELVRVPPPATTGPYVFTDTLPPGIRMRFYRLLTP